MKIQLYSKTKSGKWAASLTLPFIVMMILKFSTSAIPLRMPLPTPYIACIGVIGFIMAVISIIKNRDKIINYISINSYWVADYFLGGSRNSVSTLKLADPGVETHENYQQKG